MIVKNALMMIQQGTEVDISITEKPVSNYQEERDVDLELCSATAKKLKQIFLSAVSSGRAADFREIFEAIDTDNSGNHSKGIFGCTGPN